MRIEEPHQEQIEYALGLFNRPVECGYEIESSRDIQRGYIDRIFESDTYVVQNAVALELVNVHIDRIKWIEV